MGELDNNNTGNGSFDTTQNSNPQTNQPDTNQDISLDQTMETNSFTNQEDSLQHDVEINPTEPKQKKSNSKLIALLIAIAILLAGSITAYANRSTISNTFAILTKSPTEYYAYIEQKGLDNSIDKLTNAYDSGLTQYATQLTSGVANNLNLKLTINPQFTSMLGLGNFESISAAISSLAKGGNSKSTVGISYNDTSIITLDTFMNGETQDLYMKVPELSSAYLLFSLDEIMAASESVTSDSSYLDYTKQIQNLLTNKSLSPETLNTLLKKYTALVINTIDTVTLDKGIVLSASEISNSYSKLTTEINAEDAYNMSMAVLNEAKIDQDIINLCTSLEICTAEEYTASVDAAINDLNTNKESMLASGESVIMNVYVDKAGQIIGREFNSTNAETVSSLGYYITNKGSKYGFTAWSSENDVNVAEFTGNATHNKNGFTGNSVFSYSQYNDTYGDYATNSFNIAFENANVVENKGYFNGKYTITSDLLMGTEIVLACTADQKQQQIVLTLMYGNLEAATLDIVSKEGTFEEFTLPSDTDEVYDGMNDSDSYLATADFDSFIAKLEEVLQIDNLESYFGSFMSGFTY